MREITVALLTLLLTFSNVSGQTESDLDRRVREGKDALFRQEYVAAEKIFEQIVEDFPESPVGYGMLSITTWAELLYAAGNVTLHEYGTPSPFSKSKIYKSVRAETERFHSANDKLLAVCEKILAADPTNVLALYFQGLAYENLAAEAIAITKRRGEAIGHGKRASNIHRRVLRLDPTFVDANVSVAVSEFAKATLPWSYKWLAFLIGIRGNKEEAFRKLENVAEHGKYRSQDARVILSAMHTWKGDPQRAVSIMEELGRLYPQNYKIDLNLAAVHGLTLENPRAALEIYKKLEQTLPAKTPGLNEGELQFRIGKTYLELREYSLARTAFEKAIELPKGESETEPLAYFYLARIHEEQGARDEAMKYYRAVLAYTGPKAGIDDEIKTARKKLR